MIGIIADDSAPAATSWNRKSGIRNAAKNASSCAVRHGRRDRDIPHVAEDPRQQERPGDDEAGPCEGERRAADLARRRSRDAGAHAVLGRLDHVDERRRVVAHVARARGCAIRYASRRRAGETCV